MKHSKAQPTLSPSKRRAFTLFTFVTPILILGLFEVGLRIAEYGDDISLFAKETLAGKVYHVMNPSVKQRYFARVPFNPSTSPDYFLVPKPSETFRIFCLGGSTTVGYPYWYNGSFSSFLRDRLRRVFPDKTIEVINVGMTATNSFTVNDMARELTCFEPDLLIVYDGHNEFYGALGVASHESIARSRWLTKAYLRLIHFRSFRVLQKVISTIGTAFQSAEPSADGNTMMEKLAKGQYIPYGSDLYQDGFHTFKKNLEELVELSAESNVRVLLGSQVSNLRDLPPFVSEEENASNPPSSEFVDTFNRGIRHVKAGDFREAADELKRAIRVDSTRASAHFALAKCLDTLGFHVEANREYVKARDYDMLRFRMSSDFNTAMRDVTNGKNAIFVDMEQVFRGHSRDSLIGGDLIVEHLHPNSRGYFLMAGAYANAMRIHSIVASQEEWTRLDTISDHKLWEERAVTELDERIAIRRTEVLTSGWPFVARVPTVYRVSPTDTLGQIAERVTRAQWNWLQAHNAAAEHYLLRADWEHAKREYEAIVNQLPLIDVQPYLKLARLYLNDGDIANAQATLLASLDVSQTTLAHRALGDIAMQLDRPLDAIPYYEKTLAFSSSREERIENGYQLALAFAQSEQRGKATSELLQILSLQPDYQPAAALLAKVNEQPSLLSPLNNNGFP